jgi:hypothetical protein
MGLISKMETVIGRDIARLILLMFILLVIFTGFVALLLFLFIHFGLLDRFIWPIHTLSGAWPILILGGIFLIIPFWFIFWRFLAKYKIEEKILCKLKQ